MLKDNQYTSIDDDQIAAKTGKRSEEWYAILDAFGAKSAAGKDVCQYLITTHGLSKYWARTLFIRYQWSRALRTE